MKLKKSLALILALVMMVICFTGCGAKEENKAEEPSLSAAYDNYAAQYPANGSNGTLTVALSPDFAPMEFYDIAKSGDDAIVGFDVLLAKYIATELGMTLALKPMSFDACQAAVQTGNVDMAISGFSWTAERGENFEITNGYTTSGDEDDSAQAIICLKEKEGQFTTVESFKGYKIGYQGASLQQVLCNETFGDMEEVDLSQSYSDLGTAVEALKAGQIQFLAVAKSNGDAILNSANGTLAFTGFLFDVDEKYTQNVALLQKGDTELLEKVNAALDKAKASGIYTEWNDACEVYAGIATLDELGFDENGNKITQ